MTSNFVEERQPLQDLSRVQSSEPRRCPDNDPSSSLDIDSSALSSEPRHCPDNNPSNSIEIDSSANLQLQCTSLIYFPSQNIHSVCIPSVSTRAYLIVDPNIYPSFVPTFVSYSNSRFIHEYYNGLLTSLYSCFFTSNNPDLLRNDSCLVVCIDYTINESFRRSFQPSLDTSPVQVAGTSEGTSYNSLCGSISLLFNQVTSPIGLFSHQMTHSPLFFLSSMNFLCLLTSFSSEPFTSVHSLGGTIRRFSCQYNSEVDFLPKKFTIIIINMGYQ